MRAATELGLRTVAIYSKEDASAAPLQSRRSLSDREGMGVQAYLDVDGIVALARRRRRCHPSGYGFLSENPALPRVARRDHVVGPPAELLDLLGDKTAARRLAERPACRLCGYDKPVTSVEKAVKLAEKSVPADSSKQRSGAGTRHAVVDKRRTSPRGWRARRESAAAFGSDAVFLERYSAAPSTSKSKYRDRTELLHLHERDCSVQSVIKRWSRLRPRWTGDSIRGHLAAAALRMPGCN